MPSAKATKPADPASRNDQWSPAVEIDMLMLMMVNKRAVDGHDWNNMVDQMACLGWKFSKEGLRKHFQASMKLEFESKCIEGELQIATKDENGNELPPPKKPRKATPKKKATAGDSPANENADGQDAESPKTPKTPSKRGRATKGKKEEDTEEKTPVKKLKGEDEDKVVKEDVNNKGEKKVKGEDNEESSGDDAEDA